MHQIPGNPTFSHINNFGLVLIHLKSLQFYSTFLIVFPYRYLDTLESFHSSRYALDYFSSIFLNFDEASKLYAMPGKRRVNKTFVPSQPEALQLPLAAKQLGLSTSLK